MTTSFPADQRAACTGEETLVPGELRGFRRWRLSPSTPLGLASLRQVGPDDGAWGVEEHAECRMGGWRRTATPPHTAAPPLVNCDCGIYAWYRPDLVDGTSACPCGCGAVRGGDGPVIGAVAAAGRILLGTRGFRAARARITGLVVPAEQRILRTTFAGRGVAFFDTLDDLVAAQPPQDDLAALGVDVDAISPPPADPLSAYGFATASLSFDAGPFIEAMRRASALELRRMRNTGPTSRARAPKSIDARGAR